MGPLARGSDDSVHPHHLWRQGGQQSGTGDQHTAHRLRSSTASFALVITSMITAFSSSAWKMRKKPDVTRSSSPCTPKNPLGRKIHAAMKADPKEELQRQASGLDHGPLVGR